MNYRITSTLRDLCVKNNFFNAGTNSQYERMFELAKELVAQYILAEGDTDVEQRLIDVIWVCSYDEETDGDININDVADVIKPWFRKMRDEACNIKNVTPTTEPF